jgi:hypothetical protein
MEERREAALEPINYIITLISIEKSPTKLWKQNPNVPGNACRKKKFHGFIRQRSYPDKKVF